MPRRKETTKQLQTKAVKLKASQKPQARRSGGQPKKGIHSQKRPASDGSDTDSSDAESEAPHPRKKSRHVGVRGKENEKVEEEKDEDDVEQVDNDGDDAQSEDIEQVSLL